MKFQLETSIESFLSSQSSDFHFIVNTSKPTIETIFYPSGSLFGGLFIRLILTSVIGLIFLFIAVAGIVVVNSGKFKNPTTIPIYVLSGIGVLLLFWAYQTYQTYEKTKETVRNASEFKNEYREGLYFFEKGIIYREKKKITTLLYSNIKEVDFRRGSAGRMRYNEYIFKLNTGDKFKITQNFYNVSAVQIYKRFKEYGIELR